nr:hypothetical protein CFP56_36565 [Quercus suber]
MTAKHALSMLGYLISVSFNALYAWDRDPRELLHFARTVAGTRELLSFLLESRISFGIKDLLNFVGIEDLSGFTFLESRISLTLLELRMYSALTGIKDLLSFVGIKDLPGFTFVESRIS